jgi:hypothetical protein
VCRWCLKPQCETVSPGERRRLEKSAKDPAPVYQHLETGFSRGRKGRGDSKEDKQQPMRSGEKQENVAIQKTREESLKSCRESKGKTWNKNQVLF